MKTRIGMNDSMMDMIIKMAGGNPGAMNVCMRMMTEAEDIDPDAVLGGTGAILMLDTFNIYESHIWILYNDICGQNLITMLGLMRGVQLGYMSKSELTMPLLVEGYASIPAPRVAEVLEKVRQRLPAFGKFGK